MRNENNDKRGGERAALFAGIGAALGTGVAFMSSLGIAAIAVFAVLGAVVGMGVGFLRRNEGGS